ncbi:MAG: recombination mediator RecR [Bacteroidota bacterium]
MNFPSKLIEDAVTEMAKLPGIGKKTALRLVLHLLKRDENNTLTLAEALVSMRTNIHYCRQCHNISDGDLCGICANPHRDNSLICVVEDIRDVLAIENTSQYRGLYHVLGGIISPVEGIGPADLHIESLVRRVKMAAEPAHTAEAPAIGTYADNGETNVSVVAEEEVIHQGNAHAEKATKLPHQTEVKEIIFALNSTMEGDTTTFYLTKRLKPFHVKISTIARGVPIGGDLEYADEITLGRSIVGRIKYE